MTDRATPPPEESGGTENKPTGEEAAFIERIARELRAPEQLDVTFEARVMSAVNAEARAGHAPVAEDTADISWWRRPRTVRITPVRALAWAAGFAALVLLGVYAAQTVAGPRGPLSRQAASAAATDTVHVVRFVFIDPTAQAVSLVGDFNGWTKGATQLVPARQPGAWFVSLMLPPGRHEYAFIVEAADGDRWTADPFAALVRDEFDTESSVLVLAGEPRSTS